MNAISFGERRVRAAFAQADARAEFSQDEINRLVQESQGHVIYFAQAGEGGPIKIGTTRHDRLKSRLSVIQSGNPYPIKLLSTSPGSYEVEKAPHGLFSHLRMHGEWFWPHPDLVSVATGRHDHPDTTCDECQHRN